MSDCRQLQNMRCTLVRADRLRAVKGNVLFIVLYAKISNQKPQPTCQNQQYLFLSFKMRCVRVPGLEAIGQLVLLPLFVFSMWLRTAQANSQPAATQAVAFSCAFSSANQGSELTSA